MNAVTWYLSGDGHIQASAQVNVLCSDVGECGDAIALDPSIPVEDKAERLRGRLLLHRGRWNAGGNFPKGRE